MQDFKKIMNRIARRLWWHICKFMPINQRKVAILSYYGKGFGDNGKYIVKEILKENLDYKIVWFVENTHIDNLLPKEVHQVKFNSLSYVYHMATAKFWIDNCRKGFYKKRDGQYYIQTWHGGMGMKKSEGYAEKALPKEYIQLAKKDSKMADLFISNSKTLTRIYREAYWYDGYIMEKGFPRNDILIQHENGLCKSIKEKLNIPLETKVMMYAPTFRVDSNLSCYDIDMDACLESLAKRFGGKWIGLLRLHPNVYKLSDQLSIYTRNTIDVSKYEDIQELYIISDIMITDYSSTSSDYLLTKKPCFLYASDIEEYRKDRDFFLEIEELPFPLAKNNMQLQELIERFDEQAYQKELEKFMDEHGFMESGETSRYIVQWMEERR